MNLDDNTNRTASQTALEVGYLLDEYRIEEVLGYGGFGITYKAVDSKDRLATKVAIKEYFPKAMAVRRVDRVTVSLQHEQERDDFDKGLQRFIEEAQVLRQFRHPAVVKVLRLYEKNGTAYMIMEYVPGETLEDWMQRHPQPEEQELKAIFQPILEGLAYVHERDYLHRDIKPQNIYIRQQGGAMLLDFGSARQSIGEHTAMVTPGFAPFEQYHSQNLGPWSDIYGIGATLYYCINQKQPPVDTLNRFGELQQGGRDPLASATEVGQGKYSQVFLSSIDWMLQPLYQNRPQSIQSVVEYWQQDQVQNHSRVDAITIFPEQLNQPEFVAHREQPVAPKRKAEFPLAKVAMAAVATIVITVGVWMMLSNPKAPKNNGVRPTVMDEDPVPFDASVTTKSETEEPAEPAKPTTQAKEESAQPEKPAQQTQTTKQDAQPGQEQTEDQTPPDTVAKIDEAPSPKETVEEIQPDNPLMELPPAETPANEGRVRLTINSQPRDAIVSINGRDRGMTPLIITLDSQQGVLDIRLRKPGYEIWKNRHRLKNKSKAEIFARLSPIKRTPPPVVQTRPKSNSLLDLKARANRGDVAAQAKLGQRYELGKGVPRSYRQAVKWYKMAAYKGHAVAQLNLGFLYDKGLGVAVNPSEAVIWYSRAAQQGNSIAQTNLGLMYERGRGVPVNYSESIRWYRKAADQGNPSAQNAIGLLYIKGKGLRKNYRQAADWLSKAVAQNHAQALVNLGLLYERGLGVSQNRDRAIQYYRRAAAQGNRQARLRLSKLGL